MSFFIKYNEHTSYRQENKRGIFWVSKVIEFDLFSLFAEEETFFKIFSLSLGNPHDIPQVAIRSIRSEGDDIQPIQQIVYLKETIFVKWILILVAKLPLKFSVANPILQLILWFLLKTMAFQKFSFFQMSSVLVQSSFQLDVALEYKMHGLQQRSRPTIQKLCSWFDSQEHNGELWHLVWVFIPFLLWSFYLCSFLRELDLETNFLKVNS